MQKVLSLAQRAALYHSSTVLITGESGTGKELIARVIHQNSIRGTKPFVEVDVGAVPETLVEDFFFGHEEGAFTDAKRTRIGVIEEAHGGTLFLDEIGNMDIRLQPKLLRALQERKIKRLGGRKEIEVDFRVIAATNIDLQQMVNEGVFREDLYYRLNTFPINIPPLRERPEDIGLLVWHFVQKVDKRQPGKRIRGVEQKFVEQLKNYDWPGNVRELEHIVERAVMLSNKDVLMGDLAKESMKNNISSRKTLERSDRIERIVEGMLKDEERPLKNVIQRWCDSIDKELIRQLFQAFGDKTGAIDKVAEQYGISRVALYDKLKKYGINWKTEAIGSGS
jgi:DNA-binding NtrC family response regulator